MPVTRSTGGQGPYVTVIVSLSVLKKSSLRYEKHKMGVVRKPRSSRPQPKAILVPQPPKNTKRASTPIVNSNIAALNDAETYTKTVEKRALLLLYDQNVVSVEEHRVLCAGCIKWIPLQDKYCLQGWGAHVAHCRPLAERRPPTKAEVNDKLKHRTEKERAEILRCDPRCHAVEERRVLCGLCGLWIKLRNNTTYCTTPWMVHVKRCSIRVEDPVKSEPTDVSVPSTSQSLSSADEAQLLRYT